MSTDKLQPLEGFGLAVVAALDHLAATRLEPGAFDALVARVAALEEAVAGMPREVRGVAPGLVGSLDDADLPAPTPAEIRAFRTTVRLSQPLFAQVLGVSPLTIAAWERGEHTPDRDNRARLARLMKLTAEEIRDLVLRDAVQGEGTPPGPMTPGA